MPFIFVATCSSYGCFGGGGNEHHGQDRAGDVREPRNDAGRLRNWDRVMARRFRDQKEIACFCTWFRPIATELYPKLTINQSKQSGAQGKH